MQISMITSMVMVETKKLGERTIKAIYPPPEPLGKDVKFQF